MFTQVFTVSTSERGSALKGMLVFLVIVCLAVVGVSYIFGYVVPPGQMGVRQIKLGPYQGFSARALAPGYHWSVPFYSTMHFVPQTLQVLTLRRSGQEASDMAGSLEIQTEDGSSVFLDVSILYRFYSDSEGGPNGHGGPVDLLTKLKDDPKRWFEQIESDASNRLKANLGNLLTSQFYDPTLRQRALDKALADIQQRTKEYGIRVEGILLRRYRYTDEIDNAIFQKNLQEQEQSLNQAKSSLAAASAVLKNVTAQEDAKIKSLRVQGENKARVIRSEGDLFETKKHAEGDLLVAQARADVDRLRAQALAGSAGASVYVGKELAPLLGSLRGGIVSNVDPYDLTAWMVRLGVGTPAAAGGPK